MSQWTRERPKGDAVRSYIINTANAKRNAVFYPEGSEAEPDSTRICGFTNSWWCALDPLPTEQQPATIQRDSTVQPESRLDITNWSDAVYRPTPQPTKAERDAARRLELMKDLAQVVVEPDDFNTYSPEELARYVRGFADAMIAEAGREVKP